MWQFFKLIAEIAPIYGSKTSFHGVVIESRKIADRNPALQAKPGIMKIAQHFEEVRTKIVNLRKRHADMCDLDIQVLHQIFSVGAILLRQLCCPLQ